MHDLDYIKEKILEDIAVLTGTKVYKEELKDDLTNIYLEDLGRARKIDVDKDSTTIIEGLGDQLEIESRINSIREDINNSDSEFDIERYEQRLAKLSGGVALINVGAVTEVEMKEKKLRIEDALAATKAAVEEGIVPGGGTVLIDSINDLVDFISELEGDEKTGANIVAKALEAPAKQIAMNAGVEGSVIVNKILEVEIGIGYDALNNRFVNMIDNGIVDPTKVTRSALENAASIASMILTTEAAIVTDIESEGDLNIPEGLSGFDY